jgi:hypothetical protein
MGLLFREQGKQRAQRCFPALFDLAWPSARRNPIAGAGEISRSLLKFQFVASGCFFKYAFTNGQTGTTFSWLKWA